MGDGPARDRDHQVISVIIWSFKGDVVEAVEHRDRKPAQTPVAVDQGVVADHRFQQYGRLRIDVGVRVLAEDAHARPVDRRIEQPDIADGPHSQVLGQRQDVFQSEVLDHWPSRSSRSAYRARAPADSFGWIRIRSEVIRPTPHTPVASTPKSFAGIRDVAIPPHLVPLLRQHLNRYAVPGDDGLIFPNTESNHMRHGSMYKVFKRARKAIGRPDLRFHDLRHTEATMAAQAGATMRELIDRLGHSTPQAALIYQHAAADRQAALAARLSAMALGEAMATHQSVD